jgi:hypothetical protein
MTILVDKSDGNCSECGGQLEITGADDVSLDADCTECSHSIHVETDFFNDGGIKYSPEAMVAFGEKE